MNPDEIRTAGAKLLEYFQIGLRLPNKTFWVNLRPDQPDDMIDPLLEKTDIGRIMLETDVQLKKDLAGLTDPNTPAGRIYWQRLYSKAQALYGDQDMEIPTLTRPWIVPGEVIIGETGTGAYIFKATLKVMLEEDWLRIGTPLEQATAPSSPAVSDPRLRDLNVYATQLVRELIIPKLTREVNASKRYASLRQVYYSLILAQWYKAKFTGQGLKTDTKEISGLVSKAPWSKESYYNAYRKSFQEGEYNRQEQVSTQEGLVIRSYCSGGENLSLPGFSVIPMTRQAIADIIKRAENHLTIKDEEKRLEQERFPGLMGPVGSRRDSDVVAARAQKTMRTVINRIRQNKSLYRPVSLNTLKGLTSVFHREQARIIHESFLDIEAPAWYFHAAGLGLIIVINRGFFDKNPSITKTEREDIIDEGIFHEAREAGWRSGARGTFSKDEAHSLASAEQVTMFSEGGTKLTPYHAALLKTMPVEKLLELIDEFEGGRDRQHQLLRDVAEKDWLSGQFLFDIATVEKYEALFNAEAEKRLAELTGGRQSALEEFTSADNAARETRLKMIKHNLWAFLNTKQDQARDQGGDLDLSTVKETEVEVLAQRIYQAQMEAAGAAIITVDVSGITIPGITKDDSVVLGMMGMGGLPAASAAEAFVELLNIDAQLYKYFDGSKNDSVSERVQHLSKQLETFAGQLSDLGLLSKDELAAVKERIGFACRGYQRVQQDASYSLDEKKKLGYGEYIFDLSPVENFVDALAGWQETVINWQQVRSLDTVWNVLHQVMLARASTLAGVFENEEGFGPLVVRTVGEKDAYTRQVLEALKNVEGAGVFEAVDIINAGNGRVSLNIKSAVNAVAASVNMRFDERAVLSTMLWRLLPAEGGAGSLREQLNAFFMEKGVVPNCSVVGQYVTGGGNSRLLSDLLAFLAGGGGRRHETVADTDHSGELEEAYFDALKTNSQIHELFKSPGVFTEKAESFQYLLRELTMRLFEAGILSAQERAQIDTRRTEIYREFSEGGSVIEKEKLYESLIIDIDVQQRTGFLPHLIGWAPEEATPWETLGSLNLIWNMLHQVMLTRVANTSELTKTGPYARMRSYGVWDGDIERVSAVLQKLPDASYEDVVFMNDSHSVSLNFRNEPGKTRISAGYVNVDFNQHRRWISWRLRVENGHDAREIAAELKAAGLTDTVVRNGSYVIGNGLIKSGESDIDLRNLEALLSLSMGKFDGGSGKRGGIDFRALPAASIQPIPVQCSQTDLLTLAQKSKIQDLDKEWQEIESEMKRSKIPYSRMKEYIAVCCQRSEGRQRLESINDCLINVLRAEEDCAVQTDAELFELISLIAVI